MAYVHVIKTLSYESDIDTFSSKEKAMKKLDFYYKEFQNQENTKIIKSVSPPIPKALVRANLPEICKGGRFAEQVELLKEGVG